MTVFERRPKAEGAPARNFGMVWAIGQANGPRYANALATREYWLQAARSAGFWAEESGCIHLVHTDVEQRVLEEFAERGGKLGYECQLLSPPAVLMRSPAVAADGLLGGLWSPTEACVNPREFLVKMASWLEREHGVCFRFGTAVCGVEPGFLTATGGERF